MLQYMGFSLNFKFGKKYYLILCTDRNIFDPELQTLERVCVIFGAIYT